MEDKKPDHTNGTTRVMGAGSGRTRIVRGRVDSIPLYEITGSELDVIEQGSPSSTFQSFALCFLSIAVSFLTTLTTVQIDSTPLFVCFTVATMVGFAGGTVLLVLWLHTRSRFRDAVNRIKARIPR